MPEKPETRIDSATFTRHLNQRQLADRWNISPRTLERWRWLGQGPQYLKIGGRCIYTLAVVEAFEAEQLRQSTSAIIGTWRKCPPTPSSAGQMRKDVG